MKHPNKAKDRLYRDGATTISAMIKRLRVIAFERNIPAAELEAALRGVRRSMTPALLAFADRYEISLDWLLDGSLKALHKMTRPAPEPTPAEMLAAMRCLPPRERAVLYRTIRARAEVNAAQ